MRKKIMALALMVSSPSLAGILCAAIVTSGRAQIMTPPPAAAARVAVAVSGIDLAAGGRVYVRAEVSEYDGVEILKSDPISLMDVERERDGAVAAGAPVMWFLIHVPVAQGATHFLARFDAWQKAPNGRLIRRVIPLPIEVRYAREQFLSLNVSLRLQPVPAPPPPPDVGIYYAVETGFL